MRIIEIILKIAFLLTSVVILISRVTTGPMVHAFLVVSLLLGVVLIFNKKTSYGSWGNARKDFIMRRIEGIILIVVAIAGYIYLK